jgi:hypothetical protein
MMSTTYLAVFVGSRNSQKMAAWNALSEQERKAKERDGMAAWKAWVEKHQGSIAEMGGPLGKTKRVGPAGIADVSNEMGAFTVVRAESHERCSKTIRTLRSFRVKPSRSCRCCRSRAVNVAFIHVNALRDLQH